MGAANHVNKQRAGHKGGSLVSGSLKGRRPTSVAWQEILAPLGLTKGELVDVPKNGAKEDF
jgi:hypothetical protein